MNVKSVPIKNINITPIPQDSNFSRSFPKTLKRFEITGNPAESSLSEFKFDQDKLTQLSKACPLLEHLVVPDIDVADVGIFPELCSLEVYLVKGKQMNIKGGKQLNKLVGDVALVCSFDNLENLEELEVINDGWSLLAYKYKCPLLPKVKKLTISTGVSCYMYILYLYMYIYSSCICICIVFVFIVYLLYIYCT